ncbi:MAG TPA: EamA family transporter [Solirubrobacterales bacterium]|nr:EamA family transporter [Solirubrobacterales bacterium]
MSVTVVALGLATALAYGASDFLGGLASRRAEASLAVVAMLKIVAVVAFLAGIPLAGAAPEAAAVAWGAIAGLAVGLGYLAYFRGLATGGMGIVATVTAIWAAIVPLVAGLLLGERPSPLAWAGIGAIVVAIVLITYTRAPAGDDESQPPAVPGADAEALVHYAGSGAPDHGSPQAIDAPAVDAPRAKLAVGLLEATAAGLAFGMFFVSLDRASAATGDGALVWPLIVAAMAAAILVGTVALAQRVDWRAAWAQAPGIVVAGVLYAAGTWAFIFAASQGWISIVAVIVALSPAPTMLLARVLLSETLSARQLFGASLALVGVALITAGLPE